MGVYGKHLLLFALTCLFAPAVWALGIQGNVEKVSDGDTMTIMMGERSMEVRLKGIDAPEIDQPFGEQARQYAGGLCLGDEVTIKIWGTDKSGRIFVDVILRDGCNLNQEMVKAGYAWVMPDSHKNDTLESIQSTAKTTHIGLWAEANPIAPWEWRADYRTVPQEATPSGEVQGNDSATALTLEQDTNADSTETLLNRGTPSEWVPNANAKRTYPASSTDDNAYEAADNYYPTPSGISRPDYSAPTSSGSKDVYVRGYTRKDGTYVKPHYRSRPRR